jgi:microcin C transport system permease protein
MLGYILKRLLFIIPTLFVIIFVNFLIVQFAPGGPVESLVARLKNPHENGGDVAQASSSISDNYMASQGLDPEVIDGIKKLYGFDKPASERFILMIKNYAVFNLGESYFKNAKVIDLIKDKLPVSISLGLWSTLFIYLISIPLGIRKAVRHGQAFDFWSSIVIVITYAMPSFILAICLIIIFSSDGSLAYFPMRGIVSYNWHELSMLDKIKDYAWHMVLPTFTMTISGFATIAMLTKNSFLEEIRKQYVLTARAKGLNENRVLYGHVFRNAMLLVVAGIPDALIKILFTSSLLIEIIFSLDGLGLLGYEAAVGRDYALVFGSLYIFTLLGLMLNLITDLVYVLVDPRINFEKA